MTAPLTVRNRTFAWGTQTFVMGIVNVTPDSFSGDGFTDVQLAVQRAVQQHEASCDVVDIGAESTRPGHEVVDEMVEVERLIPVVREVRARLPNAVISVDTYKPAVFRAARDAGADLLNSVWGMPQPLLEAAAEARVPIVIMHNKAHALYDGDVVDEVIGYLESQAKRAVNAGIPREAILLDPGIGFGKTPEHNVRVLHELHRLPQLGFPTLLGTSRKSTIGKLTGREPGDRVHGTDATTALAVAAGIDMVRVHDVAAARDVVSVADAILRGWRPKEWT